MVDVMKKYQSSELAKFEPVGDFILIEVEEPGKTKAGIHIPDGARIDDGPPKGVVVKVGPGALLDGVGPDGKQKRGPMETKEGDVVYLMFGGMKPAKIELDGKSFGLVRDGGVLARVKGK